VRWQIEVKSHTEEQWPRTKVTKKMEKKFLLTSKPAISNHEVSGRAPSHTYRTESRNEFQIVVDIAVVVIESRQNVHYTQKLNNNDDEVIA
jgi:hypothetical protein